MPMTIDCEPAKNLASTSTQNETSGGASLGTEAIDVVAVGTTVIMVATHAATVSAAAAYASKRRRSVA
jgi:hypothetical protein